MKKVIRSEIVPGQILLAKRNEYSADHLVKVVTAPSNLGGTDFGNFSAEVLASSYKSKGLLKDDWNPDFVGWYELTEDEAIFWEFRVGAK